MPAPTVTTPPSAHAAPGAAAACADGSPAPAQVAKAALRRLALAKQEPTPQNYARAYAEEGGLGAEPREDGALWAGLVERLVRGLERGGRHWTAARRKESLRRLLDGSRADAERLAQRLQSLLAAWEGDRDPGAVVAEPAAEAGALAVGGADAAAAWQPPVASLGATVRAALPCGEVRADELAGRLAQLGEALARDGALPAHVAAVDAVCVEAQHLFAQRHRLVDELRRLTRELCDGLVELAEDESYAQGQGMHLREVLGEAPGVRGARAATQVLAATRAAQQRVRTERNQAREALKTLVQRMLADLDQVALHTDRFQDQVERHADAIAQADTLESVAGVVRELVDESRSVRRLVHGTRERLDAERAEAGALETRVRELEAELRRLAEEVSTDALTQVANRRGLEAAFAREVAGAARDAGRPLAVALIDIDNFKKLNDTLGHAAGDEALRRLAAEVRGRLRPTDLLARFGGEEFVVLLPATPAAEAQTTLARLQRSLSAALFLHDREEVFVTFSAGVTAWRAGEPLEATIERADEALYEAKRTGKNRTCVA